ncbi:L-seryl-tRNA(Sec) selenium transferase [Dongia soli]|uniref:L-seryl-tRNA(Sec) selenium transferase n=1 Tax=Dongia soli TaxID=600628 RepID=A0ABU5ECQ2_9PROT|nr:L-seryl-tRNA(Sec) selenium transferase [Dongia soli]MDY0883672.1 L-seryl-tRNA(Sec) selenium transferase [Dongia soli]
MTAFSPLLRQLPSVDQVLNTETSAVTIARYGRPAAVEAVRDALAELRAEIQAGAAGDDATIRPDTVAAIAQARLDAASFSSLRPIFNLTGTVLHTNLGRAVLAGEAIEAAIDAMRHAVALEYDLETGKRGERDDHLRGLICELTGAEDATIVNNNAAAVLLVLNTLSLDKDAVVSRGELIEIGGAFRMPEIMVRADARLVEVGTTNRTHRKDYIAALGPQTGLILKVHTSNYRVEGFTAEVSPRELAALAQEHGVSLLHDLGSGTLIDLACFDLGHEPTVREAVQAGADIVTFSGDKLLGGPQAGFILGRRDLIAAINRNPMKRALRVDKIRLAALEATLKLYRDPDRLADRLPTLRLLSRKLPDLTAQAARLAPLLKQHLGAGFSVEPVPCKSQIGSGALPLETVPSIGLKLRPVPHAGDRLGHLVAALRRLPVPVIGRVADGALLLDLRCLEEEAGFLASWEALSLSDGDSPDELA